MFSVLHCMTVSLAQDAAGPGTVWGVQKAHEVLGEAGFGNVAVKRIDRDAFNNYYVATGAPS